MVDDNPAKRLALMSVLAPLGYSIVEADSGVAALRCVMAQDFAVILLDVRMPTMDGIETAALIRRRRQSEMTPIIFITAHAGDEMHRASIAMRPGAVDFIFAPVVPDELRAKVSVFANLFSKAEALATQGPGGADVGRPAEAPHRRRTDRHLPDRRPRTATSTPIRVGPRSPAPQPEEAAGRKWDSIIGAEQRPDLVADLGRRPTTATELSRRFEILRPGIGAADRARHLEAHPRHRRAARRAGSAPWPT